TVGREVSKQRTFQRGRETARKDQQVPALCPRCQKAGRPRGRSRTIFSRRKSVFGACGRRHPSGRQWAHAASLGDGHGTRVRDLPTRRLVLVQADLLGESAEDSRETFL